MVHRGSDKRTGTHTSQCSPRLPWHLAARRRPGPSQALRGACSPSQACGILQPVLPPERSSGVPQAGPKSLHRWPGLARALGLGIFRRIHRKWVGTAGNSPQGPLPWERRPQAGFPVARVPHRAKSPLGRGGRQTVSSGGFGANLGVLPARYIPRALAARSPRSPCPSVTLLSPLKDLQHRQPSEWEVIIGGAPGRGLHAPPLVKPFYV